MDSATSGAKISPAATNRAPQPPTGRLTSLDALRGFDMLWIVGADALAWAFRNLHGGAVGRFFAYEFEHSDWAGFTFYDLIFPLFVFMIGVSLTFSLSKAVDHGGKAEALQRVFRRAVLMYALGILYYGGFSTPIVQWRLLGVLQRLAICYFFGSLIYLYCRERMILALCSAILVTYWALLMFVPVPGYGAGDLAEGHNLANWVDKMYLPFRKHHGDHDPEGLLSTLPAIGSCLMGVLAGMWLRRTDRDPQEKAIKLIAAGALSLVLGFAWGIHFPIIKKLWTSSFVLVAGGWSLVLLGAFYWVIDVRGHRRWAQPFVWVGMNALTIYLISHFVDFKKISAVLAGGQIAGAFDSLCAGLGGVVQAFVSIAVCVWICWFLYVKKVFVKL
jgi:predicted acyltransferase